MQNCVNMLSEMISLSDNDWPTKYPLEINAWLHEYFMIGDNSKTQSNILGVRLSIDDKPRSEQYNSVHNLYTSQN